MGQVPNTDLEKYSQEQSVPKPAETPNVIPLDHPVGVTPEDPVVETHVPEEPAQVPGTGSPVTIETDPTTGKAVVTEADKPIGHGG